MSVQKLLKPSRVGRIVCGLWLVVVGIQWMIIGRRPVDRKVTDDTTSPRQPEVRAVAGSRGGETCPEPDVLKCKIVIIARPKSAVTGKNATIGRIAIDGRTVDRFTAPAALRVATFTRFCEFLDVQEFSRDNKTFADYVRSLPAKTLVAGVAYGRSQSLAELAALWRFNVHIQSIDPEVGMVGFSTMSGVRSLPPRATSSPTGRRTLNHTRVVDLGHEFAVNSDSVRSYPSLLYENPDMTSERLWFPPGCRSRSRVAVIVPYRARPNHLLLFIDNIIRFLKLQRLAFRIYIVEQTDTGLFNRAALMNAGFLSAKEDHPYDCYVFHDVDLIPEDLSNQYVCSESPRHLVVSRSQLRYLYLQNHRFYFGGAVMLTESVIRDINGFPNRFYGWGGEDDDIFRRLTTVRNYTVQRLFPYIGRYFSLRHKYDEGNPHLHTDTRTREHIQGEVRWSIRYDGLNTSRHNVRSVRHRELYTHLLVEIQTPDCASSELNGCQYQNETSSQHHSITDQDDVESD